MLQWTAQYSMVKSLGTRPVDFSMTVSELPATPLALKSPAPTWGKLKTEWKEEELMDQKNHRIDGQVSFSPWTWIRQVTNLPQTNSSSLLLRIKRETAKMALQSLIQTPCTPCTRSEDLDSVPPLQVGILEDYLVRTGPKSSPDSGRPLEFHIPANGDDYLDLSQCYMYLKCHVLRGEGTPIETTKGDPETPGSQAKVGPVNLLFHSLFRQVDLTMNDILVSTSGGAYPYRAYITTMLSYGKSAKESWLRYLEGWQTDEAGSYDEEDNDGLAQRICMVKNGRSFELKGRLHIDMLMQERLIPNNVNVRVTLTRSRPQFHLMSFERVPANCEVHIDEAVLEVHKVKVASSEQIRLEKVLASPGGAKYPVTHVVTHHFTIARGTSTADLDALFIGQIPGKVVLGMVTDEAFAGSWKHNTFNFRHFDVNSIYLIVDEPPIPAQPLQPDFERGNFAECYHALMKSTGLYPSDWSNNLTAEQYQAGSMFLSFDLNPDDGDGVAYVSPRRLGTVKANLMFASTLLATITIIAFAQFNYLVGIDRYRTVVFDYNA